MIQQVNSMTNIVICTSCHPIDQDSYMCVEQHSVPSSDLNHDNFEHIVFKRGYRLASDYFELDLLHSDFKFADEDEYTEYSSTFYIDEQVVLWFDRETGELFTRYFGGDTHECYIKPEADDE